MNKFIIAFYGIFYLPVLTIVFSLLEISFIFEGVPNAMFPLLEVYYKEGNYPAFKKITKSALKISLFEGIIFSLISFIFAENVAYALGINNLELVKYSVTAIRIISSTMIFLSLENFFESYYMIINKVFISFVLSVIGYLIFIPVVSFILHVLTGNINGIWIGFASSDFLDFIVCAIILKIFYKDGKFPFYFKSEENIKVFESKFRLKISITLWNRLKNFCLIKD